LNSLVSEELEAEKLSDKEKILVRDSHDPSERVEDV